MMIQKKPFCPPTWNQDRVADDPLAKLEKFLIENNAKDILEDVIHIAKEQLPSNYASYIKRKQSNIDSVIRSLTDEQERDPVNFLGPISSSLEEVKPVL